nr:hypothetical protein QSJ49_13060 [Halobacterium salinarum]
MAPSSDSGARRLPLFGSLCALVFLVNFGRVVFAPLVVPLQEFFVGTSNAAVGLVATLAWLGSALPRLPAGYLLTRVARHRVVLGTGGLLTVASGGDDACADDRAGDGRRAVRRAGVGRLLRRREPPRE